MGGYATGNALAQAGVISGFDMTVEATLTNVTLICLASSWMLTPFCAAMQQKSAWRTPPRRGLQEDVWHIERCYWLICGNDFCAGGALAVPEGDSTARGG